jgi:uncharacterized protein YbgA (DUF1722 family)/uncharacterized protein YbbK (DUF523 family)
MRNVMAKQQQKEFPLRVGLSSCLLGHMVRFDGGHKKDRYLTDVLGTYFEWIHVCPELEVGMGVPRESVRLVGSMESPRMVGTKSNTDWTDRMVRFSEQRVRQLEELQLSGYILKSDSPSCGMERVRVYATNGMPAKNGRGLFAAAFMRHFPLIPVEEEGRLNDAKLRDNFIVRVFAYHRLQQLIADGFRRGDLVSFHAAHKYLILAHSPKHYQSLGKLVGTASSHTSADLRNRYSILFMEALAVKATVKKNVNVLQHIMGFLRDHIGTSEKENIGEVIADYAQEHLPLVVPLTLIRHYVRIYDVPYIRDQIYLNPHPKELMLRNHV